MNAHLTPPNEDKPSSPAHAEAAIARDVLEKALFDVQRSSARMDRTQVTESFSRALDALGALAKSHLDDDDHLNKVEAAKAAIMAVHAALVAQKQPVLDTLARDVTIVHDASAHAAGVRTHLDARTHTSFGEHRIGAQKPHSRICCHFARARVR